MPIPKLMSAIVKETVTAPTRGEKLAILRKYDSPAFRFYLRLAIDPQIAWELPPGAPPFKKCEEVDNESVLYREARRMYVFLKGGNANLKAAKREGLFISLLEAMRPEEADFFINVVKDKKLPEGLTPDLIVEAYPGI
jgi:hypothetical protein